MMHKTLQDVPLQILKDIISLSESRSDLFRRLNMSPRGGKFETLKKIITNNNIDITHFKNAGEINRRNLTMSKEYALDNIFKENSPIKKMKHLVLRYNLVENKCSECGLQNVWNNKSITLQLDHINGIPSDNRVENLRFLCPNCHSQTETFSGRNKPKSITLAPCCPRCYTTVSEQGRMCPKCAGLNNEKIIWPLDDILSKMVWEFPMTTVGEHLGVSANGVKKQCIKRHIPFPSHGYWQRRKLGHSHEESLNGGLGR